MGSEWVRKTLGDVVELKRGYDLPKKNRVAGSIPLVSSAGVSDFHSEAKVKGPGVITGRYGTIGEVFYCEEDFWPLNTTLYVRDFKGNDEKFIYYFLKTIDYLQYSDKAAVPGVNRNHLHMAEVFLPADLATQKKIAGILSALDNKIALNRQINATLESMAQALFKSWFVDFDPVIDNALAAGHEIPDELQARAARRRALLSTNTETAAARLPQDIQQLFPYRFVFTEDMGWVPEGWEVASISRLANLNPEAWSNKNLPDSVRYVDLANAKNGRIDEVITYNFADAPSRARRVLRKDDTILGTVRPGNRSFALIHEDGLTGSTGFAVLRPKFPEATAFIYLSVTRQEVIDLFAHLADGAAYPAIRPDVVADHAVVVPPEKLMGAFNRQVIPMLASIGDREAMNIVLANLRDSLLPKLLSGQLSIPEAEQALDEVS